MLEVKNLVKRFGEMTAVNDVSFQIQDGKILGLIGQNGAGKTTVFRLILDFFKANSGEVFWNGTKISEEDYNSIGYLPEERGLYPKISIEEQIIYFAKLRGKKRAEILPQIDLWMEKFQVKGKRTDKIKTLSKGNQQKVQLICTLIHEPDLVILDEPFSGLDPVNAELLKEGIIELKEKGSCVIFSSHNMDNVEKICDHLLMLKNGHVVLNGEVQEIREKFGRTKLTVETKLPLAQLLEITGVVAGHESKDGTVILTLAEPAVGKEVFDLVTQEGYIPVFDQQPPTLEEIFKLKVGEKDE